MHPSLAPMQLNVMIRCYTYVMVLYAMATAVDAVGRFVVVAEATMWTNYVDALPLLLDPCHSSR